ncbi:MAG TPA: DUF2442 domain-containing protein [Saprospiraceae bacterium]|nr:DUF2442 domain-containing protein [Saprospiraceae bacterium]
MQKVNNSPISFDKKYMFFEYGGVNYRVKTEEVSSKLSNADYQTKMHFKISPSGYGIHWPLIDEDLSFSGLIKLAEIINKK